MQIYNSKIITVAGSPIECGYISFENGVITAISSGKPESISSDDIDAKGFVVMPGLIDIHTHMGFIGDGASDEGSDVNEGSDPITPQLRAIDGLNFYDGYFQDAIKSGVTTVVTGVGSLNAIGGDMVAIKTAGRCLDDALIGSIGIKFAFGENPKSWYTEQDNAPQTRMATAALIRETLYKAKRYMEDKNTALSDSDIAMPEYDIKSEALIPLFEGKLRPHMHCHRADDIMTAMRICEEFGFKPLLVHCTEGHVIADILAEKNADVVVGPIICDRGKPELAKLTPKNAAVLYKAGISPAICTDHPEVPINYLALSTAVCVKNGLPYEKAVEGITSRAAEIIGLSDKIGSLEVGKDADIIMLNGDVLDVLTSVKMTIINGEIIFHEKD